MRLQWTSFPAWRLKSSMAYNEEDYLLISGIQHFRFCRRQWALIHIENQWQENVRTVEGENLHRKAHDASARERRGDLLIVRDLRVFSARLGITGACDVVEYRRDPGGVALHNEEGLYLPFPVEYKRGSPKGDSADELQLCAQAMCLEEMLACDILSGALFYGETRRRHPVSFTPELRAEVETCVRQMRELWQRGHTPRVKPTKACNACSMKELCLPKLLRQRSAAAYIKARLEEAE